MQYRRLGKSGLKVSELSLGSWITFSRQVDQTEAYRMMSVAYTAGINFFDNAEVYQNGESEALMGHALKSLGWGRDTYAVSSKVFWGGDKPMQVGLSRKHVTDACHAALRRLQVDYLDLYLCHRPDIDTPIEETVRAMHDLVTQGKVLYWGTSEWNAQQLTEAWAVARELRITPPIVEQSEYNLFKRDKIEREFVPLYDLMGLGTTTFSPLSSGTLTGKYLDGIPEGSRFAQPGYGWVQSEWAATPEEFEAKNDKIRQLKALADSFDLPLHHMALLWCLRNPNVSTVILGASRTSQLEDNLKALDSRDKFGNLLATEIEAIMGNKPADRERF